MTVKLLLDTDIGSDIDDAVCLAYLLAQPDCDLLGVTTVSGEAVARATLASALCKVAGKPVPVYPGVEAPLLVEQRQPHAPQSAALIRWPHETSFAQGEAVEFLRRTIRARPGEVVLLTIGPLTNIALLFTVDRAIPGMLKALVTMGGLYTDRYAESNPQMRAEWNILCDPHAAAIVFSAPVPVHYCIGLDVTLQVTMAADEVRRRFDVPLLRPVRDFAEVWFKNNQPITFHDPLAATTIFDESICDFTSGAVKIDLDTEPGRTLWQPGAGGRHRVAVSVDPQRFIEHYFSCFRSITRS